MFYFYSTDQRSDNASYHRGVLFEELLREFLRKSGYEVQVSRVNINSLEYDLIGHHPTDGRKVIGEAKAHSTTLEAKDVSAFIGKVVPELDDPAYSVLFYSISPLSPNAVDYLTNRIQPKYPRVIWRAGSQLESEIRARLSLPSHEEAARCVEGLIPVQMAQHLLYTNRGAFIVITGADGPQAFNDRFALVSANALVVTDKVLLEGVKTTIEAFQQLQAVHHLEQTTPSGSIPRRHVPSGLLTAADWLDFRRPAGKPFFVGRQDCLQRTRALVQESTGGTVVEIKARSGVGKSSLLSVLHTEWTDDGHRVELHDARDVRSASDVLSLVQRFAGPGSSVEKFEDVPAALDHLRRSLAGKFGVFMVDQFESTFQLPEVYGAYEYLALCIARGPASLAMIYTRKDDLLTTHDQIGVTFDRLRAIAVPVPLHDFSRAEATELINAMAASQPRRLVESTRTEVLEFAAGFPWLLKRTMAHIAAVLRRGIKQQDLSSSGLHYEDLFEEELSELDEQERGYLMRLAPVLPATHQFLLRRFEDDRILPKMLDSLTHRRRLLRYSADTYDTYNDVFKDFLLYRRVPDRSLSLLFRIGLAPTMQAFKKLSGRNSIDPDMFSKELGKSQGATYNTLREMRLAGLVARTPSGWIVPEVVRYYEHQGRLGEYVRQSVLKNRLVSDFIVKLERDGEVNKSEIASLLQSQMPFVEAKPSIWATYASLFVDWLQRLRFIGVDGTAVSVCAASKEEVVQQLGNLDITPERGARPTGTAFIPTREWSVARRVAARALENPLRRAELSKHDASALDDLRALSALVPDGNGTYSMSFGLEELEARIKALFQQEPYTSYWKLLLSGTKWEIAVAETFQLEDLAESTRRSLGKKLANWGRVFGLLPAGRLPAAGLNVAPDDEVNEHPPAARRVRSPRSIAPFEGIFPGSPTGSAAIAHRGRR